jgi:hypothetical protein
LEALSSVKGLAHIGRWLAKAHAYPFYVLRSTFKAVFDDGLEDWKALLVMSVAANFAALSVVSLVSIGLQHRVLLPNGKQPFLMLWGTVYASLVFLNYYTLISGRKWSRFEREFQHRSKTMRFCGGVAVWACLILLVVAAYWTGSIAWKLPLI